MTKYINLTLFLFLLSAYTYAQESSAVVITNPNPTIAGTLSQAKVLPTPGTYQLVFKNSTTVHEIDDKFLFQVNEKREFEKTITITVDNNTLIRVLPFKIINAENFVPLPLNVFE